MAYLFLDDNLDEASVTPHRIGEMDGNWIKSSEIHLCQFSIHLTFGVSILCPITFSKPVRHFWTYTKPVADRTELISTVLQFESILFCTHPLGVRFVFWYGLVNVTSTHITDLNPRSTRWNGVHFYDFWYIWVDFVPFPFFIREFCLRVLPIISIRYSVTGHYTRIICTWKEAGQIEEKGELYSWSRLQAAWRGPFPADITTFHI